MGTFSIFHWLIVFALWVFFAYPLSRIGKRAGHPAWIAWIVTIPIFPFATIIYFWVLALKKWPGDEV